MRNILFHDIVIDPSGELAPSIRIAPFNLREEERCGDALSLKLSTGQHVSFHVKARDAIVVALNDLHLKSDDVVTILTTSGNFYVSGCVTKSIETICKWNREIIDATKVLFVIHEFGYAYQDLREIRKRYPDMPIIEDRAHTFFTEDAGIGTIGDYVIYSLPKAFNMQMGSIMYSKSEVKDTTSKQERAYIVSHLGIDLPKKEEIAQKRLINYHYLEESLAGLEIRPFFGLNDGTVPGVFLFRWREDIDYPDLKVFMQSNGVESSVFYGEKAFFIPCHHNLTRPELDYMIRLLTFYDQNRLK